MRFWKNWVQTKPTPPRFTKTFRVQVTQTTIIPLDAEDSHTEADAINYIEKYINWCQAGTGYAHWKKEIKVLSETAKL